MQVTKVSKQPKSKKQDFKELTMYDWEVWRASLRIAFIMEDDNMMAKLLENGPEKDTPGSDWLTERIQ